MKRLLVSCAAVLLTAILVLSGCSSAAPAPQPTTKAAAQPAAQPTSAPAAQPASKFPTKGIELVVGFDAGSGSDAYARAFAPSLQKALGQNVTVINQGGAGGAIAWGNLAKAKPDGYTIAHVSMPSMAMAAILSKVEYDTLNSFDWLGEIALVPLALAVQADGPYKTLDDFVAAAKKDPGKVTIGATGKGSTDYSIGLSVQKAKDVKFTIVNFDGTPAGITAVMGGNLSAMGMSASTAVQYDKAGQLRTLAVGGNSRFPALPNVPTFKELGVDLLVNGIYVGFIAPKGLPADVKDTLVKAVKTAFDSPDFKAQGEKQSFPLVYIDPNTFAGEAKKMYDAAKEFLTQ